MNHSSEAPFLKREHVKEESAPLFALFAVQGKDDSFSPTLNTPISSRNVLGMLENETYIKSDVMRGDNNQLVELTISCFFFSQVIIKVLYGSFNNIHRGDLRLG